MRIAPLTIGLGLSMTVSYGVLYYSFALLAPEMARDYSWDLRLLFGTFSLSLLAGAAIAPTIGKLVDRRGARIVMSVGTLAASFALVLFSQVHTLWQFALVILLVECVAISVQYEAAFAALAQKHGMAAGRHITGVTLIAGFASTIFWPLIGFLLTVTDWRTIYLLLALLNLVVCLPVHLAVPGRKEKAMPETVAGAPARTFDQPLSGPDDRRLFMVLIGTMLTGLGFVMSAINSSIMVLLGDIGLDTHHATWAVALIGPAQVLARLMDLWFSERLPATGVAVISTIGVAIALFILLTASLSPAASLIAAFAIIYGTGQGLSSIVKGVLPLRFFGADDYGRITGVLSGYRLAFSAFAPLIIISVRDWGGASAAIAVLAGVGALSVVAVLALALKDPTRPRKPAGQ